MDNKVITVSKTVTKKVAANRVSIAVTVFGEAKKYADAIDGAGEKSASVVNAFKGLNGVTLSDGGIYVSEVRADKKTVGYRAAQSFSAVFPFEKQLLNSVLDALSGLAVEWRVSFTHSDEGERAELLAEAVKSARADGQVIAAAAGVKLGALCKVDYASDAGRPMVMRAMAYDNGSPEPERITLSETVSCSWEIEK